MFKKVLVPVDNSGLARDFMPYVSQIAKGLEIPVVLLSVVDPRPFGGGRSLRAEYQQFVTDENFETAVSETERRLNEELGEPLRQQGLRVEAVAALGEPAVEIVRTASNKGCDLIAMSTHGRGRLGRAFLGSVTSKVVHSSRLPTLIINPDKAKKYGEEGGTISRIMAPLDGSDLAETSLPYVTELARKFSLEVDLVQVVQLIHGYGDEFYSPVYVDMQIDLEKWAADYIGSVAERLSGEGIETKTNILQGFSVATSIVDFARQTPSDLIILTTHGYSGVNEMVFGGVAEALVTGSGDPVLVIPAMDPDDRFLPK